MRSQLEWREPGSRNANDLDDPEELLLGEQIEGEVARG